MALVEPTDLREEGRHYLGRLDDTRGLYSVESTFERLIRFPSIAVSALAPESLEATCHLRIESVERFSGELTRVKAELDSAAAGDRVLIACHNAAEVERLGEVFSDTVLSQQGRLHRALGTDPGGLSSDRCLDPGDRRSRALRPRRRPPPGDPAAVREPGHRQLPRPERRRPGRPRQSRHRPLPGPAVRRQVGPSTPRRPAARVRRGDEALCPDRQDRPRPEVRRRRQGRAGAVEDRVVDLGQAEEAGRRGGGRPGPGTAGHPGPARQPAGVRLSGGRQPLEGRVRGRLPVRGDARPARGDRGDQARHGPDRSRWTG